MTDIVKVPLGSALLVTAVILASAILIATLGMSPFWGLLIGAICAVGVFGPRRSVDRVVLLPLQQKARNSTDSGLSRKEVVDLIEESHRPTGEERGIRTLLSLVVEQQEQVKAKLSELQARVEIRGKARDDEVDARILAELERLLAAQREQFTADMRREHLTQSPASIPEVAKDLEAAGHDLAKRRKMPGDDAAQVLAASTLRGILAPLVAASEPAYFRGIVSIRNAGHSVRRAFDESSLSTNNAPPDLGVLARARGGRAAARVGAVDRDYTYSSAYHPVFTTTYVAFGKPVGLAFPNSAWHEWPRGGTVFKYFCVRAHKGNPESVRASVFDLLHEAGYDQATIQNAVPTLMKLLARSSESRDYDPFEGITGHDR